jgi:predicted glutamine amidotransferase
MCVILHLPANVTFPFEKINAACTVNPDGYGILVKDRGKFEVIRDYNPKGNDPDAVFYRLVDAEEYERYLHLRFCTVGAKDLLNTHPFHVSTDPDTGEEIWMMHNGTLSGWRSPDKCDTLLFNEAILQPLFKNYRTDKDHIFHDTTIHKILHEFIGSSSKVLMASSKDGVNPLVFNAKDGHKDDGGWWSSNTYSFQSNHRTTYYGGSQAGTSNFPTAKTVTGTTSKSGTTKGVSGSTGNSVVPFKPNPTDIKEALDAKPLALRKSLMDLLGVYGYEEFYGWTLEDLKSFVAEYPEAAALLVADLLEELYDNEVCK